MGCLSKHSFASPARKVERVELPELGGHVNFKELGAKDLHEMRVAHATPPADAFFDFEYDLLSRVIVDDEGKRLFESGDDMKANTNLTVTLLQSLAKMALESCGLSTKN